MYLYYALNDNSVALPYWLDSVYLKEFKNEFINVYLSRHQNWIKWIKPIRRTGDSLDEFAVSTVNQLTREKSVVIVTLADKNKLSIKIKIETLGPMV